MDIEDAIKIACDHHKLQKDKGGRPYILHVLRVMLQMKDYKERFVAVFHDILEDTSMTAKELLDAGVPHDVVGAVIALTHCQKESYEDYIERLSHNPLARSVKIADLWDNMDLKRLDREPTEKDQERQKKYREARDFLKAKEFAEFLQTLQDAREKKDKEENDDDRCSGTL